MKFLLDAQLPRRLARLLNELGHDAIHTLDLPNRNATSDADVIAAADRQDRIVVSKDDDFRVSLLLTGRPRRLLRVTTGNITNDDLIALVRNNLDAIDEAFVDASHVELSADHLVTHETPSR